MLWVQRPAASGSSTIPVRLSNDGLGLLDEVVKGQISSAWNPYIMTGYYNTYSGPTSRGNHLAGSQTVTTDGQGNPWPASETWRHFLCVPAALAVDHDHDGVLIPQSQATSAVDLPAPSTVYCAINDDDDEPGATPQADCLNDAVDGSDDLADFMPVFLDIKQLLGVLPPSTSIRYKLKQADGGLNFVYTSLTRETAFAYLDVATATTGYGPNADQPAASATTQQITAAGVELRSSFLTRITDENQGVILVEMRAMTAAPLRLVVEKNGVEITEVPVNIATGEIKWQSLYANNPVEKFKVPAYYADYTTKSLRWLEGLRYFTDGDGPSATFLRNSIYAKVRLAGAAGKIVKLRAFDVDDPTPHEWDTESVIDPNDTESTRTGNDNISLGGIFLATGNRTATATLDASGEAIVEFITSAMPGSNFRIVAIASESAAQLDKLQVVDSRSPMYVASDNSAIGDFGGIASPTLTIWRKLHIEVDSMEAAPDPIVENHVSGVITGATTVNDGSATLQLDVTLPGEANRFENGNLSVAGIDLLVRANTDNLIQGDTIDVFKGLGFDPLHLVGLDFTLTDDDRRFNALHGWQELPLHDTHAAILHPVRVKYAPAFIEIVDANAAGLNSRPTVSFRLNESAEGNPTGIPTPDIYNNSIDIHGSRYFWAHAVVFGLQPKLTEDGDPWSENPLLGGTPIMGGATGWSSLGYSAIYMEPIREKIINPNIMGRFFYSPEFFFTQEDINNRSNHYRALLLGTIAHEIGHGPTEGPDDDHLDSGLMREGGASIEVDFGANAILRFRSSQDWR